MLENLENAWLNEQNCPDILPHQTEMLELMLGQMSHMEENMKTLDKNDFRYIAHKMELERVRYVITSYLRTRLKKIEKFTKHILVEEDSRDDEHKRLSEEETQFAREFHQGICSHFSQVALQYMPPNLQGTDEKQMIVRPNLLSHIYLKAKQDVASVVVGADDEEVDLVAGSQHIIPYQLISDLVLSGKAQLI